MSDIFMESMNKNASSETVLVTWGYYNKSSWTGWLKQQTFISHSPEAGNTRSGCQYGQVFGEGLFPVHLLAVFCSCGGKREN